MSTSSARLTRRTLLGAAGLALVGCGRSTERPAGTTRHAYGSGADQYGELSLPDRTARATVVLLHGGYWRAGYGLDQLRPLASTLRSGGYAVWNLEYARVGGAGGWPRTFTDVAAGVDHLRRLDGVDPERVVLVGHSAGGHLAVWASGRDARTPGGSPRVRPVGAVSLAGVLGLAAGSRSGLGGGAIEDLMGGTPASRPGRYRLGDPTLRVPAPVPVVCVHGDRDDVVPTSQSTGYVRADRRAGGRATYSLVRGDHLTLIDPSSAAWTTTRRAIEDLAAR